MCAITNFAKISDSERGNGARLAFATDSHHTTASTDINPVACSGALGRIRISTSRANRVMKCSSRSEEKRAAFAKETGVPAAPDMQTLLADPEIKGCILTVPNEQHLPVARVTNLGRAIEDLKKQRVWVIGLDQAGEKAYDEVDYDLPLALVVGAEGKGLGKLVAEHCDLVVRLPMRGHVESLNAAVAGSIVLYHAWRSRNR